MHVYTDYQRGCARARLKHFVDTWPMPPKPTPATDTINLTGPRSFSPAFATAVGTGNTTDIFGLEDEGLRIAVFEGLVEAEGIRQLQKGEHRSLNLLMSIREDEMVIRFSLNSYGELHWNIYRYGQHGTSLVDLVRIIFNLPRLDALATLGNILGMRYNNIHVLSSDMHASELHGKMLKSNRVPRVLRVPRLTAGATYAELVQQVDILGNARQVIGSIAMYRLGSRTFCLPASVGRGELSLGHYKPTAHFLNQHLMDENPRALIVFFQDMRTALALQHLLDETRGYSPAEVIVTAHLGEDLSVLPWAYFYGHDVVFVCAPTKACMAMVKAHETQVRGAEARSFKVYLGFLLHAPVACDLGRTVEGVTEAEGKLLHHTSILDDETQAVTLLRQVTKKAVSYTEFKAWGQELGIFKSEKATVASTATTDTPALSTPHPALIPPPAHDLSAVSLHHTLRPGNYVMLLGAKGSGKTQLALSTCAALLKGNVQWPLFMGQVADAGNVAYVDAETPYDEFVSNMAQHDLAREVGHRFFGLSKFAPDLPRFCNTFSLKDETFREGLSRYLLHHQCRFVVLDNLATLLGDMVDHGKSATDVLAWVEKLQKAGLCVVLVHHKAAHETASPNTDRGRGSQLFGIRARTIIALMSKTEILDHNLGTEAVRAKAAHSGLTVGVRFTASKPAPVLELKTVWLHLPLGAAQWTFLALTDAGGNVVDWQPDAEGATGSTAELAAVNLASPAPDDETPCATGSPDLPSNCSDDERAVHDFIKKRNKAKNADIRMLLNCAATKAEMVCASLRSKGVIERHGEGSATHYRLPQ